MLWIYGLLSVIQQHSLLWMWEIFSSSSIFFRVSKFLLKRSFTSLVRFVLRYFLALKLCEWIPPSWYLSLQVHCCYVEKLLSLVCWFCVHFAEDICQVSEFFKYKMMLFTNRNKMVLPSHLWLFSFFFHTSRVKTLSTMLNDNRKNGHPFLIPDFRETVFNLPSLSIVL